MARVDTSSLERTGLSQVGSSELEVGSSNLASRRGLLECTMVRSSGLASGRVSFNELGGWLELTSFYKGFARADCFRNCIPLQCGLSLFLPFNLLWTTSWHKIEWCPWPLKTAITLSTTIHQNLQITLISNLINFKNKHHLWNPQMTKTNFNKVNVYILKRSIKRIKAHQYAHF